MTSNKSKQTVRLLCPEVRSEFIEDFFARMDADYFETFSPDQISMHIQMSSKVDRDNRVVLRIAAPNEESSILSSSATTILPDSRYCAGSSRLLVSTFEPAKSIPSRNNRRRVRLDASWTFLKSR